MDLNDIKIGYVPYLPDLSQPGDRRRFPFFAKKNNIQFEVADTGENYDIILLTASANLSKWLFYKKKHPETRFIFEMTDSLILPSDTFSNLFRGVGRFLMGKEIMPVADFRKMLIEWLKIADVVICSSTKMKRIIEIQWNKNVIVSLDYLQNEIRHVKKDYSICGKMKLVWEGQSVVLWHLLNYKEVFQQISSFCELHIITDKKYPSYGNLIEKDVSHILKQLPITTFFHEWELYKNYELLTEFDCAIIPISKKNKMAWHKAANKLISFWLAGVPAVVSDTPAYVEMMKNAGTSFFCSNTNEWVSKIKGIRDMTEESRKNMAERNLKFVQAHYSNESLHSTWFQTFESLQANRI